MRRIMWSVGLIGLLAAGVAMADRYVSPVGTNGAPYTSWASAATNIQTAINAANGGEIVWVTGGVYIVTTPVTVGNVVLMGFSGKAATIIDGNHPAWTSVCFNVGHVGAVVDGFTIRYGRTPSGNGGGVSLTAGLIRNCNIISNYAGKGGGVYMTGGTVSNCFFAWNAAGVEGGGLRATAGLAVDCVLSNNVASTNPSAYDGGGGLFVSGTAVATNCTAVNNTAGGLHAEGSGQLLNCIARGNVSSNSAAGLYLLNGGYASGCTIEGNTAKFAGGVRFNGTAGVMVNSTISANTDNGGDYNGGGGILFSGVGTASNCVIRDNEVKTGGKGGGGVHCFGGGLLVNCLVVSNRSAGSGGGVMATLGGTVRNCLIAGNMATNTSYSGGGLAADRPANGGGLIESCTIVSNLAYDGGGMSFANVSGSQGTVSNCIIYGNTVLRSYPEIAGSGDNTNAFGYCCAAYTGFAPNRGNTNANPLFVNAAAADYRLKKGSPCINAGQNVPWMSTARDLNGKPRLDVGAYLVDMGAYEVEASGTIMLVR